MNEIMKFLETTELRVFVVAVCVVALTALVKAPIKRAAARLKNRESVTRFITFLPVALGLGVSCVYLWISGGAVVWGGELISLWLSSSSLSLAIYAFLEKFVPSKAKILSEEERRHNEELIEQLKKAALTGAQPAVSERGSSSDEPGKIILRGRRNETDEK